MYRPDISGWRKTRAVNKVRDQYRYSLAAFANRHRAEKNAEDKFLIGGLLLYIGLPIIGYYTGYYWLSGVSIFAFVAAVFFPFIMSFYQQYVLAKKLTLTMMVVADNPEETRPFRLRLQGVEFGSPMSTREELIDYIQKMNGHLTHAFVDEKNGEAKRAVQLARDKGMKLYPMLAEGDAVPSLSLWPDDPEKCLRAREEKVRLSYGIGKVRHATAYAFECKPVKTSIHVKDKILDVEYALFAPFFTQHDIDHWLKGTQWFIPTRIAQEVATFVKQQADMTKNASFFGTLEKQRDDAVAAYDRLLLHQQFSDVQKDVEGDVLEKYRGKRMQKRDYVELIVAFALGVMTAFIFLGSG